MSSELLDFLKVIESVHAALSTKKSIGPEPSEEIECIVARFSKFESPMPEDQWIRVYTGLKKLSQIITKNASSFAKWPSLSTLFLSAKKFKKKWPTAESGEKARAKKQNEKMSEVLKFAQEFADDTDINMKEVNSAPPLQSLQNKHPPNGTTNALHRVPPQTVASKTAMNPKMKKATKKSIVKAQVRPIHAIPSFCSLSPVRAMCSIVGRLLNLSVNLIDPSTNALNPATSCLLIPHKPNHLISSHVLSKSISRHTMSFIHYTKHITFSYPVITTLSPDLVLCVVSYPQSAIQHQNAQNVPFTISRSGGKPPQLSQKKPSLQAISMSNDSSRRAHKLCLNQSVSMTQSLLCWTPCVQSDGIKHTKCDVDPCTASRCSEKDSLRKLQSVPEQVGITKARSTSLIKPSSQKPSPPNSAARNTLRDRDRPRNRLRDSKEYTHSSSSNSRSRSRSRSRDRHKPSSRHGSSRSSSHDRDRSERSERDRDRERPSKRSKRGGPPDEWGLPPPAHDTQYVSAMCAYQTEKTHEMTKVDRSMDSMEIIPVKFGDSEICHGFNEGRCRTVSCRYEHACWSCKGRDHPSRSCPYRPCKPFDAPSSHSRPCINWNLNGCPGGCLCADRHVCLFCLKQHPLRHSKVCHWKFNREIEMGRRKPVDPTKTIRDYLHLNPVGQYEYLRLKEKDNGGTSTLSSGSSKLKDHSTGTGSSSSRSGLGRGERDRNREKMTPPPSMVIPSTFMAKQYPSDETVSITEICVLFNTPSGCPARFGRNDDHLHHKNANLLSVDRRNPNKFNGVCPLKHRCRECFGRHSFFECPFRVHGIKVFIANDIVRYDAYTERVYVINGFVYPQSAFNKHAAPKTVTAPRIKITEVGLDFNSAQIEIEAATLDKIASSVKMRHKFPKMMIKELPTTISMQQVENKLKLLFNEKGIRNVVRIQSTGSQSNWIIHFLSVDDREDAFDRLKGCSMQARELKIAPFEESADSKSLSNSRSISPKGTGDNDEEGTLKLITKDEVPVNEHLYYCSHCDVGLYDYGLLRKHLVSASHCAAVKRSKSGNHGALLMAQQERVEVNECILCNTNIAAGNKGENGSPDSMDHEEKSNGLSSANETTPTMEEHIKSTNHDNSNILMMLSLVRTSVNSVDSGRLKSSTGNDGTTTHNVGESESLYRCNVCNVDVADSRSYFVHCNSDEHRSGLEEAIEPCPYFNKRGGGCENERCQFKHVCVGCNAVTPISRCKRCKNNEVCNMFNKGGGGCWYATGSCHRRHICHHCRGAHPIVACPLLYPNNKKVYNAQGQEVQPGQEREAAPRRHHDRGGRGPPYHHHGRRGGGDPYRDSRYPPRGPPPPHSSGGDPYAAHHHHPGHGYPPTTGGAHGYPSYGGGGAPPPHAAYAPPGSYGGPMPPSSHSGYPPPPSSGYSSYPPQHGPPPPHASYAPPSHASYAPPPPSSHASYAPPEQQQQSQYPPPRR